MAAWIAYFFAGVFLANGMPHFIQGIRGKKFQTPFAKPWGSESSAVVNVIWGVVNFIIASVLLKVGDFPPANIWHLAAAAVGFLAISVALASYFGKKS